MAEAAYPVESVPHINGMTRNLRTSRWLTALAVAVALAGCASLDSETAFDDLDAEAAFERLVAESPYGIAPDEDVLAVSGEMRAVADAIVRENATPRQRLNVLGDLFVEGRGLELEYQALGTYTAAETLMNKAGNCLAFTHLFVAIAREIGLDSRYREMHGITRWDEVGDYVLVNRHVGAFGEIPRHGTYEADFGQFDWSNDRFGGVISDARARAQHFNNLGVRALTAGDPDVAVRYLNRALVIDGGLSYVWGNLGTALVRLGHYELAEPAYRQALRIDIYDATAVRQLVRLYEALGEEALATKYNERAQRLAQQNPYRQFAEGMEAMAEGDLNRAVGLLERAARTQPKELHFHLQLGKALALQGYERRARNRFIRAANLAEHADDERVILEELAQLEMLAAERRQRGQRVFTDTLDVLPPRPVPP
jgi:tetratricopeptide (TPR) repeat protein